jgi:hypothetical protein
MHGIVSVQADSPVQLPLLGSLQPTSGLQELGRLHRSVRLGSDNQQKSRAAGVASKDWSARSSGKRH